MTLKNKSEKGTVSAATIVEVQDALKNMKAKIGMLGDTGIVSGVTKGIADNRTPEQLQALLVGRGVKGNLYNPVSNPLVTCLEDYRLVIGGSWPKTYKPYFFAEAKHEDVDFSMTNCKDISYYAVMDGSFDLDFSAAMGLQSNLTEFPGSGVFYAHGGKESINNYIAQWANTGAGNNAQGIPVSAGSVIGTVGTSGSSTTPHLHFGILTNGKTGGGTMIGNGSDALYAPDRFTIDPAAYYTSGYDQKYPYSSDAILDKLRKARDSGYIAQTDWTNYWTAHSFDLIQKYGVVDYAKQMSR